VLHSAIVSRDRADRLWWVSSKKGLFKVKFFFSLLACFEGRCFPLKSVWRTQAPSRAAFFIWSTTLGKILIVDNLRKMHIIIVDRCCLCKRDEESVDHLLLHCDLVCLGLCLEELSTCLSVGGSLEGGGVLRLEDGTHLHFLVCLEGNKCRCFEDLESSMEDLLALFFHTLCLWTVAFLSLLSISFVDFLVRFSLPS
jgi:hypothetical protein